MQYKTILLELLQQQPRLHEQLRTSRQLLALVEAGAVELKTIHKHWKEQLAGNPNIVPGLLSAAAMEYAQHEMKARLQRVSNQIEHETLTLDSILALVRSPTSQG